MSKRALVATRGAVPGARTRVRGEARVRLDEGWRDAAGGPCALSGTRRVTVASFGVRGSHYDWLIDAVCEGPQGATWRWRCDPQGHTGDPFTAAA